MSIPELYTLFQDCTGISTDTRSITKDNLFFALKGENFNGNKFAEQALEKGAKYVIIDEKEYLTSNQTILVDDALTCLQDLAQHHRRTLGIPIISITGSNGKTTTKELINTVLSQGYNTAATKGNLNNHIGVPLTLLSMNESTEIAIVELGANHHNEIAILSNIAEPDYGYITNFGKAHLEGFGSVEGVVKAKSELYDYLRKNNKMAFVNLDDPKQAKQAEGIQLITFSSAKESTIHIKLNSADPFVEINFDKTNIKSNLIGNYNFNNIAAAVCIGNYFKISTEKIQKAIEKYTPTNNRSQIIRKGEKEIILDAYNANPSSMAAALDNFSQLQKDCKVVILGDMFELGNTSAIEHQKIVDYLEESDFDKILLFGEHFEKTTHSNKIITYHKLDVEKFSAVIPHNATLLVKGSRGMALERVIDLI
ncbi:MAG: UDP-N-acetylmuramoyl-tripeptide--D-alanyl-D-alanine ligase [Flavobacteriaceae bacterium]|nr:UDP-N-acetylmuramoyl-tripeptide--D-alanyl-D-alanine ligase [Flavobacteriaceae bacterium]